MRNFYSMPNTQIPNNQKAFAELKTDMTSCKEGNIDAVQKSTEEWKSILLN